MQVWRQGCLVCKDLLFAIVILRLEVSSLLSCFEICFNLLWNTLFSTYFEPNFHAIYQSEIILKVVNTIKLITMENSIIKVTSKSFRMAWDANHVERENFEKMISKTILSKKLGRFKKKIIYLLHNY
jgi:hypothetical protein